MGLIYRCIFHAIRILSQIGCIYGRYLSTYYENVISDCKLSRYSLWETSAPSLSLCCLHCAKDRRCLSVSYRGFDRTCTTHAICPLECSRPALAEPGWSILCHDYQRQLPRSCLEIKRSSLSFPDGVYVIHPYGQRRTLVNSSIKTERGVQVYCDMTTDGGGWTVFQHRFDGSVDFYRDWEDYKGGFGDPEGEYWIGNDILHELTEQGECKLRIDMVAHDDETGYVEYSNFTIGSEQEEYILNFNEYNGTVGDALSYHNGKKFTTKDRDNDEYGMGNCAITYTGAWWYSNCHQSNLNSVYVGSITDGMWWQNWKINGDRKAMKNTTMMIIC